MRDLPGILAPGFLRATLANFLFFSNLSAFYLLPLHLKGLGATESQVGLVMGVYSATAILCQPLVGGAVDRLGRRPFLLAGAVLAGIASAAFALLPGVFAVFPLLRLLQGLGYSAFYVATFTLVADLAPAARRGQTLGLFGTSGLVATAVAPALGEPVLRLLGFRVFALSATAVAIGAVLVALRLAEPPRALLPASAGLRGVLRGIAEAPRLPTALAFAFGLGLGVVFTFLPTYAEEVGVRRLGLFFLAYGTAALSVRTFGGQLIDTLGRRPIILPALLLQALGAGLLALLGLLVGPGGLPALPFLVLIGGSAGAAHGFLYPALTALIMDVTAPEGRGRALGVFSAFVLAGHAFGAMAFGPVAHALGHGPMFALLAGVLLVAFAAAFRLAR